MKKITFMIILLLIPIICFAERIPVTFKKCVDGDTAWFIMNDEEVKVRFIGIDAPEIEHEETPAEYYSLQAKAYVCNRLDNAKKIELEFDPNSDMQDKYERFLAWVFVNDKLLQDDIVKKGFAKVTYLYDNYKYSDILIESEKKAKSENLGIWINYVEKDFNYYFSRYKNTVILIGIFIIYLLLKKKR